MRFSVPEELVVIIVGVIAIIAMLGAIALLP